MSPAVRALAAGALSGLTLLASFPPPEQRWVAFLALAPLFLALRGARGRHGALAGGAFGIAFFGLFLNWIKPFGWLAWGALTLTLASFVVLFGVLAAWSGRSALGRLVGWPLLWTGIEMFRGRFPLGGFEWGGLGYTQAAGRPLAGLARVGGAYAVGLVLVAINALVAEAVARGATGRQCRDRPGGGGAGVRLAVAAGALAGLPALLPLGLAGPSLGAFDVAVVQGNVPRGSFTGARGPRRGPEDLTIIESHARLSDALVGDPPDLVIWPENGIDRDPFREPGVMEPLQRAIARVRAPFLVGAILDAGPKFRNSNVLFDADGDAVARYDKIHLVPFGEYVPWTWLRRLLPALEQIPVDGEAGERGVVFEVGRARVGSVICFEAGFPRLVRDEVRDGAEIIVVSTNNASFGDGPMAREHLAMSRMRAIENGRWVVHAAITGITGVIAPDGRVVRAAGLFRPALVRATVERAGGRTFYSRAGVWLEALYAAGALLATAGGIAARARRRRAPGPMPPPEVSSGVPAAPRPGAGGPAVVVIPTYNEVDNIREVIARALAAHPGIEVLVVDDNSPDGTGRVAEEIAAGEPRVRVLHRPGKGGLGPAYLAGFADALARGSWAVIEMDADLSHDPADLPRFLEAARAADLVIGSRYVPGGRVKNWSKAREMLSRGGNAYVRTLLRLPVADATAGYRCYRREVLEALPLDEVSSSGYGFQIEMVWRTWTAGFDILEIPITFLERTAGASKMTRKIVAEALGSVWRWSRLRVKRPREPHPRSVARALGSPR